MESSSVPIPRTRQVEKRESALRASIFDTALELGVGTSKTVAHWMFGPIGEEDEEAENTLSPSLTYASTATSDESWPSQSSLNRLASDASNTTGSSNLKSTVDTLSPQQRSIQFQAGPARPSDAVVATRAPTPNHRKLRKAKHDDNGYESDAGYVSDAVEKDKKKKKKDAKSKPGGIATGEESDGGYLSEVLARRRRKKKEKKEKGAAIGGATEDESDGGYLSSHSKKDRKAKKLPTSPGDDSDGGYLSESTKRKRFMFGLNNKSRKRQDSDVSHKDIVPPVPSLPPLALPVAERFATMTQPYSSSSQADSLKTYHSRVGTPNTYSSRADTPNTYFSRAETPASNFTERASSQLSSDDRLSFSDTPSRGPTPIPVATPLASPNPSVTGLTSAFNDAQSVRTPSTDILRVFGKQALATTPRSPLSASSSTPDMLSPAREESSMPSSYTVPTMGMPPPKRNPSQKRVPPQISAPNTQGLSVRTHHSLASGSETSIPVTLTPPTPTPGVRWRFGSKSERIDHIPSPASSTNTPFLTPVSSSFDSLPSSPSSATPSESAYPSPLLSPGVTATSTSSAQLPIRPTAFAKYDIPPPSPPPAGPLPQPPVESGLPMTNGRNSKGKNGRPGTADSNSSVSLGVKASRFLRSVSPQPQSPPTGPLPAPPLSPPRSGSRLSVQRSTPAVTASIPVSVSPPSPPRSENVPPLFLQRIPSRQRGKEPAFPTQPVIARKTSQLDISNRTLRTSEDIPQPRSAGAVLDEAQFQREQRMQLNVTWQPRSASALDHRPSEPANERQSWVEYEDQQDSASFRTSTSSRPDIDSVLSALQDRAGHEGTNVYNTRSAEGTDEDNRSKYTDDDEDFASRYSVFNDENEPSRLSILDKERSSDVRQKFLRQVEEMYSKDGIAKGMVPPVPRLPPPSSPRWK